ncbi:hypothetical protein Tco_0452762 [Tanacetum coccineum]
MLLAIKDEAGSNLNNEENDFMLDTSYGEETMEELTATVMLMARIQPADGNAETVPSYDAKAISEVNASLKVHNQMSHVKCKNIIHTSNDDQIDSNIIFDDPFMENNGGTSEHDSNAHDEYNKIQMLAYNVQREAENKKRLNNELEKQKELLQKRLRRADKDTIERILKEKDKIQSDFLKIENEKLIIQHETRLAKKAFKERENQYLEDICDLEEKLIGLGYKNLERLNKVFVAQQKMYNGDMLHSVNLKIDSPDSEETLEDAKESRLKMKNKMVQINYGKLNALYEIFVPQQEFSVEQTYFSIPSTSNNGSESKDVTFNLPILKMPKESKLLKMFDTMGVAINGLQTRIDKTLLEDKQRRWMSDNQNLKEIKAELIEELFNSIKATRTQNHKEVDELIEHINQKTYAYAGVRTQNQDLLMTIYELKNKLRTIEKGKHVNTKFDKSETLGKLVCVTPFNKNLGNKAKNMSNTKVQADRSKPVTSHPIPKNEQSQKQSANVIAKGMYRITKIETQTPDSKTNIHVSNSTGVESSNSVRRPKSKGTKSKNRVLKNTKSSFAYVWKISSNVSIFSNKCETKDSNVCQTTTSVSNSMTVNVVNDGLNIVCISCGLLSHEKCVAHYSLSRKSNVKRALFTTPVAAKSKNLGATSVVAKSRLSVAKPPKVTNKVFSASSLSCDYSQSKTLSNYMKNRITTSQKWHRWFEYQQSFNWSPKSKTTQSLPSETKSCIRVRSTSNTPITTQKWVVKLSTLPSAFVSCDAGDSARPLDC